MDLANATESEGIDNEIAQSGDKMQVGIFLESYQDLHKIHRNRSVNLIQAEKPIAQNLVR